MRHGQTGIWRSKEDCIWCLDFFPPELPLGEMDQASEWCHLKNIGQGLEYLRAFLDLVNGFAHLLCRGC